MRMSRVRLLVAAPNGKIGGSERLVFAFLLSKSLILRQFANVIDLAACYGKISRFLHGGIPKRSTGSDCKSDGSAFEGSNPSPATKFVSFYI